MFKIFQDILAKSSGLYSDSKVCLSCPSAHVLIKKYIES